MVDIGRVTQTFRDVVDFRFGFLVSVGVSNAVMRCAEVAFVMVVVVVGEDSFVVVAALSAKVVLDQFRGRSTAYSIVGQIADAVVHVGHGAVVASWA